MESYDNIFFGVMTLEQVENEEREERAQAFIKSFREYFVKHFKEYPADQDKKENDNGDDILHE